jgi:hypothetical protein
LVLRRALLARVTATTGCIREGGPKKDRQSSQQGRKVEESSAMTSFSHL